MRLSELWDEWKGAMPMSTIEERVQALEQEHAELKQKIELQTLANRWAGQ